MLTELNGLVGTNIVASLSIVNEERGRRKCCGKEFLQGTNAVLRD